MYVSIGLIAAVTMTGACNIRSGSPSLASADSLRLGIAYPGDSLERLSDGDLAATLDDAVAVGTKWIRIGLLWSDIQPDSATDFRWGGFDRVTNAAGLRGLAVLPVVIYTPQWARAAGCSSHNCAPDRAEQFASFVGEAASRYPRITTWEIWNEPNTQGAWQPSADAVAYAKLLTQSVSSIRKSNPSAQIFIGGLSITGGITPQDFLTTLVQAGATNGIDGVALHPYTYPNLASERGPWVSPREPANSGLQSLRSIFTDAGLPPLPIWITEYGAPTGGSDHVTETRQAEIATDAVKTAAADDGVAALFWYTYRDWDDPSDPGSYYGLRRADGSKKPAYDTFRQAIADSFR
jgi:hypothetical protein